MSDSKAHAVYVPHNEPYLGAKRCLPSIKLFRAPWQVHTEIGSKTFSANLSPLQRCAAEIIPHGISISLSIRELLRQAYLFSAAVLMRPLVERTGLMQHLVAHPNSVDAWHAGWPRKSQPSFDKLFMLVMPDAPAQHQEQIVSLMHKLVHTDPKSALFNMFKRPDGSMAFASGKILSRPDSAETIAELSHHCLRRLTALSAFVFGHESSAI